jgi:ribosomal protein L22
MSPDDEKTDETAEEPKPKRRVRRKKTAVDAPPSEGAGVTPASEGAGVTPASEATGADLEADSAEDSEATRVASESEMTPASVVADEAGAPAEADAEPDTEAAASEASDDDEDQDDDVDEESEPEDEELVADAESEAKPRRRRPGARRRAAGAPAAPTSPVPARRRRERAPGPPPVVRAQAKYVRSSARKARLVCDHIRGKSVEEARAILALAPRAVARDWSKLLESAVANAEHNHELVGEDLYVKAVHADEGPTIKRFRPRAMGRATKIRKRTSHLTILLTPKD